MATPSNNLWVGNQPNVLTDSDLKNLFSKYGNFQSVTTPNPLSNYAFVYFNRTEDAMPAVKGPRGSVLRGNEIQIDFAKPDQKPHSAGNGANERKSKVKDDKNQRYRQQKQQQTSNPAGQGSATPKQGLHQLALSIFWRTKLNGQPSNVLWIGYPPSVGVEEQMFHIAMMFGEAEIIRSFPSHDYSRVEFRSVDGAWHGKEGLQCCLLNDPRAKPCKSWWVSGISLFVTKETLQEEFPKFGKIEEFKFIGDRKTAYVAYFRLEDACQALKGTNGKQIGSD